MLVNHHFVLKYKKPVRKKGHDNFLELCLAKKVDKGHYIKNLATTIKGLMKKICKTITSESIYL